MNDPICAEFGGMDMQLCVEMRFFGNGSEALDTYARAFGAACETRIRYKDALGDETPEGKGEYIWHAEIHIGGVRCMLSDEAAPGDMPIGPAMGCAVSFQNPGELFRAYYALKPGAYAVRPLREEPFSECVANLTDRFGMRWGLLLEHPKDMPMTAPLSLLRPSQLYVSEEKLKAVESWLSEKSVSDMEPLPVKLMGGAPVLTDGHTRAVALFRAGVTDAPIRWETDDWDFDAIAKCVSWCEEEGVANVGDLASRVLNAEAYQKRWNDRCERML